MESRETDNPSLPVKMNALKEPDLFSPVIERLLATVVILSVIFYVLEVEYGGSAHSLEGHTFWLWMECVVAGILTIEISRPVEKRRKRISLQSVRSDRSSIRNPLLAGFHCSPCMLGIDSIHACPAFTKTLPA